MAKPDPWDFPDSPKNGPRSPPKENPMRHPFLLCSTLTLLLFACGGGGGGGTSFQPPTPPPPTGPVFTVVETIAGQTGQRGSTDGNGNVATFNYPYGVAATKPIGAPGNEVLLYIAGLTENIRIQQVGYAGNPVSTAIGLGTSGTLDGGGTTALVRAPYGITIGYDSDAYSAYVYWTEPTAGSSSTGSVIRKLTAYPLNGNRTAVTVAGSPTQQGAVDGSGMASRFNMPRGVFLNRRTGELFISDTQNFTIRRYRATAEGAIDTIAGLAGVQASVDGTGAGARFLSPSGMAMDRAENLYVTDHTTIRKITPTGVVSTFAGKSDVSGHVDGAAADARFNGANGIAIDEDGNLYVSETRNHTIRKISPAGVVTTVAGIANVPGAADGAISVATFHTPTGIAYYNKQLFVADTENQTIRRIR